MGFAGRPVRPSSSCVPHLLLPPQFSSLLVLAILSGHLHSSPASVLEHLPPATLRSGEPALLEAMIAGPTPVLTVRLLYRIEGQESYRELFLMERSGLWSGVIPGDEVVAPLLEYALVAELVDGSLLAFPRLTPLESPHRVVVTSTQPLIARTTTFQLTLQEGAPIALSPEENSVVAPTEVLIAASLFDVRMVDSSSVKLLVDGTDITLRAAVSSAAVTYQPNRMEPGLHTVRVEAKTTLGFSVPPLVWSFVVKRPEARIVTASEEFTYSGQVGTSYSYDMVESQVLPIAQSVAVVEGGWEWLKFKGDLRLTSDESAFYQPRNRFGFTITAGPNLTLSFGDFSPMMSPYTISGKRVRGLGVDVDLKLVRFQAAFGELERVVQGSLSADRSHAVAGIEQDSLGQPVYTIDRRGYTFARDYRGYRFLLSPLEQFRLGLTMQKVKDYASTVTPNVGGARMDVSAWDDSTQGVPAGEYTFAEFEAEASGRGISYRLLDQDEWGGSAPRDNFVFGIEAGGVFDDRRVSVDLDWAISFANYNIWNGAMTKTELDTALDDSLDGYVNRVYDDEGAVTSFGVSLKDIVDPASVEDLFIVNQFMVPLSPVDVELIQTSPTLAYFNMPASAYRLRLQTYYYGNTIQVQYSQVGPEFLSLANPYLTPNLREFSLNDRLRLFDNKLALLLKYSHRNNDILPSTLDPYGQNTISSNLSFTPGAGLPSFTFDLQSVRRYNEKTELDTIKLADSDSLVDRREDTRTRTWMFSLNLPLATGDVSHTVSGSLNTMSVLDLLADLRDEDFVPPTSDSRGATVAITSQFHGRLRTAATWSSFDLTFPQVGEQPAQTSSIQRLEVTATVMRPKGPRITGGGSMLQASGVQEFAHFGLSGGLEAEFWGIPFRMTGSLKVKRVGGDMDLGALSLKVAMNYVF